MNNPIPAEHARLMSVFASQKSAFSFATVPPVRDRITRLKQLLKEIRNSREDIVAAIDADFGGRSADETLSAEIGISVSAIKYYISNLKGFAKPKRLSNFGGTVPGRTYTRAEAKGVVGIIAPWNYPFQLAVVPAITALAAGNRVIIKPSEFTPATATLLSDLFARVYTEDEVAVVTGGPDVGAAFSALPFDHLFYTGSTHIGSIVAQEAAKNLTPVTLELGGKSPCIMMPDADPNVHGAMVAFGKFYNAGQTCVSPDYLLVPKGMGRAYGDALMTLARDFYPKGFADDAFSAVINDNHLARITRLVADAEAGGATIMRPANFATAQGGSGKYAPTVLLAPASDAKIMSEEIFGPVLPIIEYDTVDDAVAFVTARDHPLALYIFGKSTAKAEALLEQTTSGSAVINGSILQVGVEHLPFGGVGKSGYGAYHGERGFREFTHERSVLVFPQMRMLAAMLAPPYGKLVRFVIDRTIG